MKELKTNKICTRSVFDETVPGITFNEKGEANFCNIHDKLRG